MLEVASQSLSKASGSMAQKLLTLPFCASWQLTQLSLKKASAFSSESGFTVSSGSSSSSSGSSSSDSSSSTSSQSSSSQSSSSFRTGESISSCDLLESLVQARSRPATRKRSSRNFESLS